MAILPGGPTMRPLLLTTFLISGLMGLPSARAGEGSSSIVGDVVLPSGPMVIYSYHFDHNAFSDSVDLPGGLVALTPSGKPAPIRPRDPQTRSRVVRAEPGDLPGPW